MPIIISVNNHTEVETWLDEMPPRDNVNRLPPNAYLPLKKWEEKGKTIIDLEDKLITLLADKKKSNWKYRIVLALRKFPATRSH